MDRNSLQIVLDPTLQANSLPVEADFTAAANPQNPLGGGDYQILKHALTKYAVWTEGDERICAESLVVRFELLERNL